MTNKYNARGVWFSLVDDDELLKTPTRAEKKTMGDKLIYFHSQHEFNVYLALREKFNTEQINCHVPIDLKPRTEYFKATQWSIDFEIFTPKYNFFVEAKGVNTREFELKLAMLEYFDSTIFNHLLFVFPSKSKQLNRLKNKLPSKVHPRIYDLKTFSKNLKNGKIYRLLRNA